MRYGEQLEPVPIGESTLRMLAFIMNYTAVHGYPPAVRDIGEALALRSTATVHERLQRLRRLGFVELEERHARTLHATLTVVDVNPPRCDDDTLIA